MAFLQNLVRSQLEAKAIPAHPILMDRTTPIAVVERGGSEPGRITQREAPRHLQAYGGNEAIDWIMDCVRLYADTVSNASYHFRKNGKELYREEDDHIPDGAQMVDKRLDELMREPNPFMDYEELMSLLIIDLLLVGNAYWMKWRTTSDGKPIALYRLAPPFVNIIPGPFGPLRYEYTVPGQRDPLKLEPEEVIHFRLPNPHSPYYGLGIIQGGGRPLDLELALTEHQASYFEKGTNPSMIVQSERRVPRDVFQKLRAQMRSRYGGPRNAGDLMVLEAGLKATTITPNAADAGFEPLTKLSRDRIFAMFRISPRLVGLNDEASGSDKVQDARREWDNGTMRPFMNSLQKKISRNLTAPLWDGIQYRIDYRYIMPREEQIKLGGDFAAIPGVTVAEVREFVDLPPLGDPGIDELVLNLPGDNGDSEGTRDGIPDRPLGSEPGRPPKGDNTASFGTVGGGNRPDLVRGSRARRPSEKAFSLEELEARIQVAQDRKAITLTQTPTKVGPVGTPPEDTLRSARDQAVDEVAASIQRDFTDALRLLERQLLDGAESKKHSVRANPGWNSFRDFLGEALERNAQEAISSSLRHQARLGHFAEDVDYDAVAKSVVWRSTGVPSIVRTLKDRMAAAVENETTLEDTQRAIQSTIIDWRQGSGSVVALTEAVEAYNEGTLVAAADASVSPFEYEDSCEDCAKVLGEVWDVETARQNRTAHPNCRRGFVIV